MRFVDDDPRSVVQPYEMVKAFACRKGGVSGDLSLEELALITFTPYDLKEWVGVDKEASPVQAWSERGHRLYRRDGWIAVQSAFGAPNAVMLLEELIAFGVKRAVYFGYCGSLRDDVRIGDIVIPMEALREEGTSYHYLPEGERTFPDRFLQGQLYVWIKESGLSAHMGGIWTTDAPYRETPTKVSRYGEEGVLGVEMEMSAVFALGMMRGISVGAILIVSDELSGEEWRIGFFSPEVKVTRKRAIEKLLSCLKDLISPARIE